jgi:hypothetical protein
MEVDPAIVIVKPACARHGGKGHTSAGRAWRHQACVMRPFGAAHARRESSTLASYSWRDTQSRTPDPRLPDMTQPARKSASSHKPDYDAPGLPGEAAADNAHIPPAYWRAFSLVGFTMNRFIVDHVVRSARMFDNDIETMILFGMLSHLNVAHLVPPGSRPSQTLNAQGRVPDPQPQLRPVRIRDLTLISGRPRETIRRKVEALMAQGRVLRVDGGYVLNVASVDPQMHALTLGGVKRFLEAARLMQDALSDAEQALAQQPPVTR